MELIEGWMFKFMPNSGSVEKKNSAKIELPLEELEEEPETQEIESLTTQQIISNKEKLITIVVWFLLVFSGLTLLVLLASYIFFPNVSDRLFTLISYLLSPLFGYFLGTHKSRGI